MSKILGSVFFDEAEVMNQIEFERCLIDVYVRKQHILISVSDGEASAFPGRSPSSKRQPHDTKRPSFPLNFLKGERHGPLPLVKQMSKLKKS